MISDIEHLFIYSWAICMSFLDIQVECLDKGGQILFLSEKYCKALYKFYNHTGFRFQALHYYY